MRFGKEIVDDVVILVPGRLLAETEALELELYRLIEEKRTKIVLDLGKTEIIASPAIKALEKVDAKARENNIILCFCNIDHLAAIPAIFWIIRKFRVYGTREECLRVLQLARADVPVRPGRLVS
jgi:anti-anti-sigma regulatory factor